MADVAQHLLAVAPPPSTPAPVAFPARPEVPLSTSALLVNGRGQPRIGYEVEREVMSVAAAGAESAAVSAAESASTASMASLRPVPV